MPHWNFRANAQVSRTMSSDHLLTTQSSILDAALRHIGCAEEASLPGMNFLQVAAGGARETSQDVMMLFIGAFFLLAILVGGVAFWCTVSESGKIPLPNLIEDGLTSEGPDTSTVHEERKVSAYCKKVSNAEQLFPSYLVGSDVCIKGTLTCEPEDVIVKVCDDQGALIARAIVCEQGEDPGILVEDHLNNPLAFIDTSEAVYKTQKSATLFISKLGEEEGTFGSMRLEDHRGRLVVRNSTGKFLLALHGDPAGSSLNVLNDRSSLIGSVQRIKGNQEVRLQLGADAGLLICALFGMGKLFNPFLDKAH